MWQPVKPLREEAIYPIRSPNEHALRINYDFSRKVQYFNKAYTQEQVDLVNHQKPLTQMSASNTAGLLPALFGRGDPLEEIVELIDVTFLLANNAPDPSACWLIDGYLYPKYLDIIPFYLLLVSDSDKLKEFVRRINLKGEERFYLYELWFKAFIPDWKLAKKCSRKGTIKFSLSWSDPLLKVLSSDNIEIGLQQYLNNFANYRVTNHPYQWVPWAEFQPKFSTDGSLMFGNAFHNLAYSAALAVCAWDLDDSLFGDNPYYPRDLVDYYRKNIRHTRDSWREWGNGPDIPVQRPQRGPQIDLSTSKSKNFKRWIELLCDGDKASSSMLFKKLGNLKTIEDADQLLDALGEDDVVAIADCKDSETLKAVINNLLVERELSAEGLASVESSGPQGFAEVLKQYRAYVTTMGYQLLEFETNWDCVVIGMVKSDFHHEFLALSEKFRIPILHGWMCVRHSLYRTIKTSLKNLNGTFIKSNDEINLGNA